MNTILKGLAGAGFIASPMGNLPEYLFSKVFGVLDVKACLAHLDSTAAASSLRNPCFPANPDTLSAMPFLFVIIGLLLLLWAAWPYLPRGLFQRKA